MPPDDPAIRTETVEYPSPEGHGTIRGLMARPADASGPLPAVLVVHENRGLNPYIEDVVRRDRQGGVPGAGAGRPDAARRATSGNDDEGRELQAPAGRREADGRFLRRFRILGGPSGQHRAGRAPSASCYGGGVCNALAVAYPTLAASVPFYGRQADAADVPAIQAPLLLHYAELETGSTRAGRPTRLR